MTATLGSEIGSRSTSGMGQKSSSARRFALPPRKTYRSTLRRALFPQLWQQGALKVVTRQDMVQNPEHYQLQFFGAAHHFVAPLPLTVGEIPDVLATKVGPVTLERPFVAEIPEVQLVGPSAVGIGRDRSILMETVLPDADDGLPGFEGLPVRTLLRREMTRFDAPEVETLCSLMSPWSRTYGHWTMDCLPMLEGVDVYQQQTGLTPKLLINQKPAKWQMESLKLLGFDPENCVEWQGQRTKVKRLVVPSFRRQYRWSDPMVYQWMRDRIAQNLPPLQDKTLHLAPRILISRSNAVGRQIINQDDVEALLKSFGFVSYQLETMSFADEMRLFAQAEAIVGTHGSGLANMLFAQNKPAVIDLYSTWLSASYYQLATSMGAPYACFPCQACGSNTGNRASDMRVDIAQLRAVLEQILPSK